MEARTLNLILSPVLFPKHHNYLYKIVAEYLMNGLTHPGDHEARWKEDSRKQRNQELESNRD